MPGEDADKSLIELAERTARVYPFAKPSIMYSPLEKALGRPQPRRMFLEAAGSSSWYPDETPAKTCSVIRDLDATVVLTSANPDDHDSRAGILGCCFEPTAWRCQQAGQGKGRALNAWLRPLVPLRHEELGRSLASTHPPPEPYAKQSRQCENEKVTGNVATTQTPIAPMPVPARHYCAANCASWQTMKNPWLIITKKLHYLSFNRYN
ncbi:unnamed protein product [Fusarium graminearum]|nr:unnamed protein product [Fusarium graminearum]